MPSIGQTWVLASIGAVVEMGVLGTLKRLPMESSARMNQSEWVQSLKIMQVTKAKIQTTIKLLNFHAWL
jgi:hypothetical protein